ncbi:hypothetical protein ACF1G5_16540 [Streptomyces coeruleorubidus]|uniref:hypothetical protein n=1 Tax=Streptomyces coeruleorubidus TaxID=116188 RepID=UPI0036FAECED
MDPIVLAAGTALVSAMATDAWQRTATAVADLWKRARGTEGGAAAPDHIPDELASLRASIVRARNDSDSEMEESLAGLWRLRLHALIEQNPSLVEDLRALVRETLLPEVDDRSRVRVETLIQQNAQVSGGTNYMAGRDMRIHPGEEAS